MSQSDVFELLKCKRLSGDDRFFSMKDIQRLLSDKGIVIESPSLQQNLRQLRRFGYLNWIIGRNASIKYRVRKDCL